MWRLLLLFALASPALAQSGGCLDDSTVWTTPYSMGTIQAISYYGNLLVLGVYGRSGSLNLYVNVPLSVAQQFTGLSPSADNYYSARIKGHYSQALLAEVTGCPLLNESTGAYLLAEQ